MIALNILKSTSGFTPIFFSIIRTMSFVSSHGASYQDIRWRTLSFPLISSFKTLLLAQSIEITPSGAEFDNEVLNDFQESGREPSRSKTWIYLANLMPIVDIGSWSSESYSDGLSSENYHDNSNSTSILLRTLYCFHSSKQTNFQDALIGFKHVSPQKYDSTHYRGLIA